MTHIQVSEKTRDALKEIRKDKGLASMDEVIKRLLIKCKNRVQ